MFLISINDFYVLLNKNQLNVITEHDTLDINIIHLFKTYFKLYSVIYQ